MNITFPLAGCAVAQLAEALRYKPVRFTMGLLGFYNDLIHSAALWPWGRLGPQQERVTGIFPGGQDGRCGRLITLRPSCDDFLEILGASTFWTPKDVYGPAVG
jgi:hypothetical protein